VRHLLQAVCSIVVAVSWRSRMSYSVNKLMDNFV